MGIKWVFMVTFLKEKMIKSIFLRKKFNLMVVNFKLILTYPFFFPIFFPFRRNKCLLRGMKSRFMVRNQRLSGLSDCIVGSFAGLSSFFGENRRENAEIRG